MNPAIIGGGYAGMAAAVTLSAKGVPVTVFESAKQVGGRARGVPHSIQRLHADNELTPPFQLPPGGRKSNRPFQGNNLMLDNGQHILLGCYRETLRLIQQVGGNIENDFLRLPLQLTLHQNFELRTPRLPAPLHLFIGLLTAKGLSFEQRLSAARFMFAMRRMNFTLPSHLGRGASARNSLSAEANAKLSGAGGEGDHLEKTPLSLTLPPRERGQVFANDIAVLDLLRAHNQNDELIRLLWEPICIAALNTPAHKASAQVLLNVLRDSLDGARGDSDMLLPRLNFSALFPERAAKYIKKREGAVLTSCGVEAIIANEEEVEVRTARGSMYFSHVICAASPANAAHLLRGVPQLAHIAAQIEALAFQPIYTVYLQYPATVRLPQPMLGFDRCFTQWLFDKGQIAGQHGLIAAVISAEGLHQELEHEQLAQKVAQELREQLGITAMPLWQQVIAEKRATFSCEPNLHRPAHTTPLANVLLAGDYTAGDYPATLEGAVMSGVRCANLIF